MSRGVVLFGLSLFLAAFLNLVGGGGGGGGGKGGKKGLREKSLLICAHDSDKRGGVYVLYSTWHGMYSFVLIGLGWLDIIRLYVCDWRGGRCSQSIEVP